MIIIPIKWLFHLEYTLFSDIFILKQQLVKHETCTNLSCRVAPWPWTRGVPRRDCWCPQSSRSASTWSHTTGHGPKMGKTYGECLEFKSWTKQTICYMIIVEHISSCLYIYIHVCVCVCLCVYVLMLWKMCPIYHLWLKRRWIIDLIDTWSYRRHEATIMLWTNQRHYKIVVLE